MTIVLLDEDFGGGAEGAFVTTVQPGGDLDPVDGNNNTDFDIESLSGNSGRAIFVEGRSGLGITRQAISGVQTLTKWMPGYNWQNYTANPFTGELSIECWYKISDAKASATYALIALRAQPQGDVEGSEETTICRVVFNDFNVSGSVYLQADSGNGSLATVGPAYRIPKDVWLKYTLTYTKDPGTCRLEINAEDTSLLLDTGDLPLLSWNPTQVTFSVTNSGGTQYILDDVLIQAVSDEAQVTGVLKVRTPLGWVRMG